MRPRVGNRRLGRRPPAASRTVTTARQQASPSGAGIPAPAQPPQIAPDEDAAALPPRPRFSHLLQRFLARKLDQGCAARGLKAVADSAARFQEANEDPELDGLGNVHMRKFLSYLRERKTRDGQPLANNTIIKHFANLGKLLAYGGPEDRRGTKGNRTCCRSGLYGFDVLRAS